ncbi:HlyD family secretion protein, partial [Chloroflexota bacterium]
MNKQKIRLLGSLMLVLSTLVSFNACTGDMSETKERVVEVTRGDITLSVTGDGDLSLLRHRKLTFRTSGEILTIDVEEGDRVSQGQVLASLNSTRLKQEVENAERAIATAELAVIAAELATKSAEVDIKVSEGAIKAAELDMEQASDSFRQIAYPYTYSTFVFDVPEALTAISNAERQLKEVLANEPDSDKYWEERAQLKEAQENLTHARERLSRGTGQDVFEQELLAINDFWTLRAAQLAVDKSETALIQAKNNREKSKLAVDKARNEEGKVRLALNKVKSDLSTAKYELDKTVMYAPFDGIIAEVEAKTGDILSAATYATEIIMEVVDPSRMELVVEVDEIDIPDVKPQQRAIISLDALPGIQIDGQVTIISTLPTEEVGVILYEVKIVFNAPADYALKAGMTASAEIIVDEQSGILTVPKQAVMLDKQGKHVVKVVVEKEITEREV